MIFSSPVYFLYFLPVVLVVYYLLTTRGKQQLSKVWLVMASFYFYGSWNIYYLLLLSLSLVVNYYVGLQLQPVKSGNQRWNVPYIERKTILVLGILFNLGLLGYYKYADFFINNLNLLLQTNYGALNLLLPLAISFFTFQQIAYLVDSYKNKVTEGSILDYSLFVTFFPQLVAGPIVHHTEMMPQFRKNLSSKIDWELINCGLLLFSIGLFKKVFIADHLSVYVGSGFDSAKELSFFEAWGSSLSYTLQLYYDFSGYSDMALGVALMLGIRLPMNFNSPYKAANIADFWKRWHMTLMRWLRDYLYIPLRQRKKSEFNAHLSILLTFLFSGFWHGAGWLFVLFGLMHGVAQSIHRIWRKLGLKMPKILGVVITFLFFNITLVLFRSNSMEDVRRIFGGMFDVSNIVVTANFAEHINRYTYNVFNIIGEQRNFIFGFDVTIYLIVFGGMVFLSRNSLEIIKSIRVLKIYHAIFIGLAFLIAILSNIQSAPTEFLYYNF